MRVVGFGEETAAVHFGLATHGVTLVGAAEVDVHRIVAFIADLVEPRPIETRREQIRADAFDGRTALGNRYRILIRQGLSLAFFRRQIPRPRTHLELEDDQRIGAETTEHARDCAIESRQNRAHPDDGSGADDYSQHSQESPQLMLANGVKSQSDAGENGRKRHG